MEDNSTLRTQTQIAIQLLFWVAAIVIAYRTNQKWYMYILFAMLGSADGWGVATLIASKDKGKSPYQKCLDELGVGASPTAKIDISGCQHLKK